ncbi:MAG: hypothetical protein M1835_001864 [Candelina submexicana]|nr:MAG: hypothetical protein M1835_001864 [Candelina submexicana]
MTFGAQGFFGYGACSTEHIASENGDRACDYYGGTATLSMGRKAIWWSTYETKGVPETRDIDRSDVRKQLLERHAHWRDPVIQKIIHEVEIENLWPVWTTPKLPTWEAEGCVLVGDAAHALPPSSGQGVSQALEDAHTLALLLSTYLTRVHSSPATEDPNPFSSTEEAPSKAPSVSGRKESPQTEAEAFRLATKVYTTIRKPRVEAILDYARKMGDMKRKKGIIEEWLMYGFLWVLLHLPMENKQNAFLYDYDVDSEVNKILKARDEEACTMSLE